MWNLEGIKGQPVAVTLLSNYLEREIPPLLILHGPDGVGKWSAAEAFIRHRFCQTRQGCGNCTPCRKLQNGSHPDLIAFSEEKIQIGDHENPEEFTVRWLLRTRIRYAPNESDLRFILIPRADLILHEAETALLKTLEEPPEHTKFIFLTPDLSLLKETIVSRGLCIPFQRLNRSAMV